MESVERGAARHLLTDHLDNGGVSMPQDQWARGQHIVEVAAAGGVVHAAAPSSSDHEVEIGGREERAESFAQAAPAARSPGGRGRGSPRARSSRSSPGTNARRRDEIEEARRQKVRQELRRVARRPAARVERAGDTSMRSSGPAFASRAPRARQASGPGSCRRSPRRRYRARTRCQELARKKRVRPELPHLESQPLGDLEVRRVHGTRHHMAHSVACQHQPVST